MNARTTRIPLHFTVLAAASPLSSPAPTIRAAARWHRLASLPPRGLLMNRFDLVDDDAYFAETDATAVYETLARREATMLSRSGEVALRELLTVRTGAGMTLQDLRTYAPSWPVLQSLRYSITQTLAASFRAAGSDGVVYRSAQQHGADCYVLFGAGLLSTLQLVSQVPLYQRFRPPPSRGSRCSARLSGATRAVATAASEQVESASPPPRARALEKKAMRTGASPPRLRPRATPVHRGRCPNAQFRQAACCVPRDIGPAQLPSRGLS